MSGITYWIEKKSLGSLCISAFRWLKQVLRGIEIRTCTMEAHMKYYVPSNAGSLELKQVFHILSDPFYLSSLIILGVPSYLSLQTQPAHQPRISKMHQQIRGKINTRKHVSLLGCTSHLPQTTPLRSARMWSTRKSTLTSLPGEGDEKRFDYSHVATKMGMPGIVMARCRR